MGMGNTRRRRIADVPDFPERAQCPVNAFMNPLGFGGVYGRRKEVKLNWMQVRREPPLSLFHLNQLLQVFALNGQRLRLVSSDLKKKFFSSWKRCDAPSHIVSGRQNGGACKLPDVSMLALTKDTSVVLTQKKVPVSAFTFSIYLAKANIIL